MIMPHVVRLLRHALEIMCLVVFAALPAMAQPIVSYLLPDVGAPGTMVYVEFIAPNQANVNGTNFANTDGLYINNVADAFRLECVNAADRAKITFSPVVVSWDGRMLSTIAFISPICAPNSSDWTLLADAWRIPVQISRLGVPSNVDTFYIVKPTHLGDLSSVNEFVIGEGTLGKRSRRGAMVIDSVIFRNNTYTVSTTDVDAKTDGNQGYLPFSLYASGRIVGAGSATKLSLEANGASGAPGGGGGGGGYCDVSGSGGAGGPGYTGGGRGGRNASGVSTNSYNGYGQGSGPPDANGVGNSLNGTSGSAAATAYESAGGGTGHPFGTSGSNCSDGGNCAPQGGHGGASGEKNTVGKGAGAGNKSNGESSNSVEPNGGYETGNIMNVPLAGGSGGSSGNPSGFPPGCSGNGGGGGGAVQLYALSFKQVDISATGSNGASGKVVGGSGSGGGINLASKLPSTSVAVHVSGGKGNSAAVGSDGRVRMDGPIQLAPSSDAAADYVGPTIDTISAIKPPFSLRGYGKPGDTIAVYLKSDNTAWVLDTIVKVGVTSRWAATIDYTGADQNLQIVAAQKVTNPATGSFGAQPSYVLSAAAATTIHILRIAEVSCDSIRDIGKVSCANNGVKLDTFYVRNLGNADVVLDSARFLTGTVGFSIVSPSPAKNLTLKSKDSIRFIVRFQMPAFQAGVIQDRMLLSFPVGTSPQVLTIDYKATVDTVGLSFINVSANTETRNAYSIDFNRVCATIGESQTHGVRNISAKAANITQFKLVKGTVFTAVIQTTSLNPNDTAQFVVRVPSGAAGSYRDTLQITILTTDSCTISYRIPLSVTLVDTKVVGYDNVFEDFGYVKVGATLTRRFTIINRGTGIDSAAFLTVPTVSAPWTLTMVPPDTVPRILAPGDSIVFLLSFKPDTAGPYQTTLLWTVSEQGASCPATVRFQPHGFGTNSSIVPSVDTLRFGTVYRCSNVLDTFWIRNAGSGPAKVYAPAIIGGPDAARFQIVKQPTADSTQINNSTDSLMYVVAYVGDPTDNSVSLKTGTISIRVFDDSARTIVIPLMADQQKSTLDVSRTLIIVNNAPINQLSSEPLQFTNSTATKICIDSISSQKTEISVNPPSPDIDPGRSNTLYVNITPKSLSDIVDTLTVHIGCPCIDSIKIVVIVHPTNNALTFTSAIDFDTVHTCVIPTGKSVTVQNIDAVSSGFIDSVKIQGPNASVFSMKLSWTTFPYVVQPKNTDGSAITIYYDGAGTPVGDKNALLIVWYHINNQNISDTIPLHAYREVPIHLDSTHLDFGAVKQAQIDMRTMHIFNDYTQSIEIDFGAAGTSKNLFVPQRRNFSILGKNVDTVDIQFNTASIGDYSDTLYVRYFQRNLGCTDSIPLTVHGVVLPGVNYRVWLDPSTVVNPTDNNVAIHMWAALDTVLSYTNTLQFKARVNIPADMFRPNRIDSAVGRFIPDPAVVGTRQSIDISVDTIANPLSTSPTMIAIIRGQAMLGHLECDSLIIEDFYWDNSGPHPTNLTNVGLGNGEYCTTICKANGSRLLSTGTGPLSLSLSPNPNSGLLHLNLHSIEAGTYAFDIVNENGQVVDHFSIDALSNSSYLIDHDCSMLSSGVFSLRMTTLTRMLHLPFVVVK